MKHPVLLDGKELSRSILNTIKTDLEKRPQTRKPTLAFILVGEDRASQTYVAMKMKRASEIGFESRDLRFDQSVTTEQLIDTISGINNDNTIDGLIVQQPLPSHIDLHAILTAVDPKKDIDGFHPVNLGKLAASDSSGFTPCTPKGIARLLDHYDINLEGKEVVIVGRSLIVGKSLALLLGQNRPRLNATVTLAHSKTHDIASLTRRADVVVAAVGRPSLIQSSMIKEGAVVVDVGVTKQPDGQIVGDVDFASVSKIASYITPVPGGIGPMTIAMLLSNTYEAYQCNFP